ncbi:hypothetical protein PDESU_06057 [Pontiella desulfatans]|uniref:Uncharacterized protein n=1 Tax=Pontiella desulfatans TaxID=2750659 RepID=A0A6C2UDG5_PONDE|nr:hypothetical protein [Pontiella desulfatans]VGO17461.1 hypothetical protein PDESU_06057 [Pontiella desulfatans]
MKKSALALALAFGASMGHAAVVFEDDFSSYAEGQTINGVNWNPKWDGNNDLTQQDLMTATNGYVKFDTSIAKRNYFCPSKHGFSVASNKYAVIGSDFRYFHEPGGNITEPPNKANQGAFGLLISTTPTWWDGVNKSFQMCNRGSHMGNKVPVDPWQEGWQSHLTTFGVDTTAGGFSDWFRIEWTVVQGEINYEATAKLFKANGDGIYTATTVDLGITNGATLYAGFSPGWNDINTNIAQISKFSEVDMDNFKVEVVTIPNTRTIFSDDFESGSYVTYPLVADWRNPAPWSKALNNPSAYEVTNGVMKTKFGYRGIVAGGSPVVAAPGETIRIAYDVTIDLGSTFNTYQLGDYMFSPEGGAYFTNYVNPILSYDHALNSSGLARRVEFNAWTDEGSFPNGRVVVNLNGGSPEYYLAEDLGLAPGTGADFVSDPLRMAYEYTKRPTVGLWECVTLISNMHSAAMLTTTQLISRVDTWNVEEFFFSIQNPELPSGGGWEIDNLVVQVSSGPDIILVGFEAWAEGYGLLGGADDDQDGDGLSNLYEYGLNGDPTNAANLGTLPQMTYGADHSVSYTHPLLLDSKAGISYVAEWRDNLSFGDWSSVWLFDSNYPAADEEYNERLLKLDGLGKDRLFMRFRITQP